MRVKILGATLMKVALFLYRKYVGLNFYIVIMLFLCYYICRR